VGVMIYRAKRPEVERPFRMWLYPLPALEALAGFTYILISRPNFQREILLAAVLIVVGVAAYLIRANSRREWPFAGPIAVSS